MTVVRVPASTANLGPGFDAIGMALTIHAEVGVLDTNCDRAQRDAEVDEHHPASIAFERVGGRGVLWVRSPIPVGRGLGFSGAMRVAGAAAAIAQDVRDDADRFRGRRADVLAVASELEGHPDNAAASLYGGIVVTAGPQAEMIETPLRPDVVVWIPPDTTSTAASRTALPASVAFVDAVFNVSRTALLVAALASGNVDAMSTATQDRLHQERRFAAAESSRRALSAGLAAGAWCGWLSGSGPAIALLTASGEGARLASILPSDGHTKVVAIDRAGVTIGP